MNICISMTLIRRFGETYASLRLKSNPSNKLPEVGGKLSLANSSILKMEQILVCSSETLSLNYTDL